MKEDLEFIDYCPDDTMDSFSSIKISKTITFDNIQQILVASAACSSFGIRARPRA